VTTTALTPRQKLKAELAQFEPSLQSLLPAGYEASRLITGALIAAANEPKLLQCTPVSIATACARVAQWGLDIGTTAHLMPYGERCTAVADYKGLIALMCRAGARKVEANVVREGDEFAMAHGTEPYIRHTPRAKADAPIVGAYAIAWLSGGGHQFEYMAAEEIEAIRQKHSLSWKKGPMPVWYARKCVVRRLAKYVQQTPTLARVLAEEDNLEVDADGVVLTPAELDGKYERVRVPSHGVPDVVDPYEAPIGDPRD